MGYPERTRKWTYVEGWEADLERAVGCKIETGHMFGRNNVKEDHTSIHALSQRTQENIQKILY